MLDAEALIAKVAVQVIKAEEKWLRAEVETHNLDFETAGDDVYIKSVDEFGLMSRQLFIDNALVSTLVVDFSEAINFGLQEE
jgi:hypothetical protein